jgi:hypothetical protein
MKKNSLPPAQEEQSFAEKLWAAVTWKTVSLFSYFLFWIVYFALFWSEAVFYDAQGNFVAGHVNIWGDWAVHFTMATAMAQRGLIGLASPLLIGQPFSYPFVADGISSVLLRMGVPFIPAFTVTSFLFSLLLVVTLYLFYTQLFRSRKVALVSSLIFLFNGGLGFAYFFNDIFHSAVPFFTLLNPPHEYTRIDQEGIRWISVIDSMIIPQRAFALGFSLAVLGLFIVWRVFFAEQSWGRGQKSDHLRRAFLALAGVFFGLLPIVHTHSFLAVFVILGCWSVSDLLFFTKKKKVVRVVEWVGLAGITAIISLPLLATYFFHNATNNFYTWYPGWLARDSQQNWLWFWWQNWGVTPYLACIGLLMMIRNSGKKYVQKWLLFLPFFILFALANLILFQPWPWDNTKIIVWAALGFSGLAGYVVVRLTTLHLRWPLAEYAKKMLIPFLFFVLIASGGIDAYRILRTDLHSYIMYSADDLKLAEWVKTHTDTHSLWLTNNHHNHWLFNLTGRQSVMTYPGWLWTQGYRDWPAIQDDVKMMYLGDEEAEVLFKKYNINYVVIGDLERRDMMANESYFAAKYPVVYQLNRTQIYKIQ